MQSKEIIVSISCITYNHAPYIRQCLDGFMMQKTDFAFEVLIHDDASTDGTSEIIKEYETRYPDIIKPIYEDENQWVKGRRGSAVFNFPRARGKYIALCEGDDYWTDPLKLQKQVEFLEVNPSYVMCSHLYKEICGDNVINGIGDGAPRVYSLHDLVMGKWYFQPLSLVFRMAALDLELLHRYQISIDVCLIYSLLKKGLGICLNEEMGVYRRHPGGVWAGTDMNHKVAVELNTRLCIYNEEKSDSSSDFLLSVFSKPMSRKWAWKNRDMIVKCFIVFIRHKGLCFSLWLFFRKFLFGKVYIVQ